MSTFDDLSTRVWQNMGSGIWPHSRADQYFIFCVSQDPIKINAFVSFAVNSDIGVKPMWGRYKDATERSFIANMKNFAAIVPWLDGEESILVLGATNGNNEPLAYLRFLETGQVLLLGRLVIVPRDVALKQVSWTYDPFTKNYYVCSGTIAT